MTRVLSISATGLLTASSRQALRGTKNRKAALPDPNNFASLIYPLVLDWSSLGSPELWIVMKATHVYAVRAQNHISSDGLATFKLDLAPFGIQADHLARCVKLCGGADFLVACSESLELLMKTDAVHEMPWVLPLLARDRGVEIKQDVAGCGALLDMVRRHGTTVFGEQAPSPQHAVTIGRKVNSSTGLIGKAGFLVNLTGNVSMEGSKVFLGEERLTWT